MLGFTEKEVEFTTVKIYLAELFGNAKIAAIVDRYFTQETRSNDHTSSIKISYSSIFNPSKSTQAERDEWERNKKLLQGEGKKKYNDSRSLLIKNKIDVEDLAKIETKTEIAEAKEKMRVSDYQGKDLFTLKMKDEHFFSDQPKGVVVIQLQALDLKWDLGATKSLYLLISTSREIHKTRSVFSNGSENLDWGNDVVKLKTYDQNDYVYFKLYD
jgi:hypothetical protein